MKKIILFLLPLLMSFRALAIDAEISCVSMGYTTPVLDCIAASGTPLVCPYYRVISQNTTGDVSSDERLSLCLEKSCRGYPLLKNEEDGSYYYLSIEGGKVSVNPPSGKLEDLIEGEMDSCTVGLGNDAITYYRVPQCKDGYLYQNNACGEGCSKDKYPYNYHPGNLAGEVEECVDTESKWYGYMRCYDGWTGGYSSEERIGKCVLAECKIEEFPYVSDPKKEEYRGETGTCRIGGNPYYKYVNCVEGFTQSGVGGVCIKDCKIRDCEKSEIVDENGVSYNDWTCSMPDAPTCRIGDNVFFCSDDSNENCIKIGTVIHMPDETNNRVVITKKHVKNAAWGYEVSLTINVPYLSDIGGTSYRDIAKQDYSGKQKTAGIKKFAEEKGYTYPAAEACYTYDIGCDKGTVCAVGEWYLPAFGEDFYMYDNRYILSQNGLKQLAEMGLGYLQSSSEADATTVWVLRGDGFSYHQNKSHSFFRVFPTLSFKVK